MYSIKPKGSKRVVDGLPPLMLSQTLEHGTDNEFVRRLMLQFWTIMDSGAITLEQSDKDTIKERLQQCAVLLIEMKELCEKYREYGNNAIEIIRENLKTKSNIIAWNDPTIKLTSMFNDFVSKGVMVLRQRDVIAEIVFGEKYPKNHGGEGKAKWVVGKIREFYKNEPDVIQMLDEDRGWYKEFYDLRGNSQHDMADVSKFEFSIKDDNNPDIKLPKVVVNGMYVHHYMQQSVEYVFTYMEDIIALLLNIRCIGPLRIVPIEDNSDGMRYVLSLAQK